jgi:hypothetical integral membrane protein (TIGR02206 family)
MLERFYITTEANKFVNFGLHHLCGIAFFVLLGAILVVQGKKSDTATQERIGKTMGWVLTSAVVGCLLILIGLGRFDKTTDLPLHICNTLALLAPVLFYYKNNKLFQIFYYSVMAATTQAILTPHLEDVFPHYMYIKYFTVHCGLVVAVWYAILVQGFRPTFKGMFVAFGALQIFSGLLIGVNYLLGANYMYLNHKPPVASLLDYFGPEPYYVITVELVALLFFAFYYLPFYIFTKKSSS